METDKMNFGKLDKVTVMMAGISEWKVYPMDCQEIVRSKLYKELPHEMEIRLSEIAPDESTKVFAICYAVDIPIAKREIAACYLDLHKRNLMELEESIRKEKLYIGEIKDWQQLIEKESSRKKKETWCRVELKGFEFIVEKAVFNRVGDRATLIIGEYHGRLVGNCIESRLDECKKKMLDWQINKCRKKTSEAKKEAEMESSINDTAIKAYERMKQNLKA